MNRTGKNSRRYFAALAAASIAGYATAVPAQTITGSVGTVVVNDNPYSFLKASDGNIWVNHWNGSAWAWNNLGTPSGVSIAR